MKTIDHLMLGRRLLAQYGAGASGLHRRAFLLGCIEPDYNLLSYLRGLRRHKKFHGHNAENAAAFLSRCTALLDRRALPGRGLPLHSCGLCRAAAAIPSPHGMGAAKERRAFS